ncbi:hypothetical protein CJF42_09910 [Pseudoalteromonas sp. NBT06-2]|uniref:hypothetical protein n=1 Tax=Pseudoalteromonas sp. NBT06-2 TaxID=2025950 RepID=UPI000BA5D1D4|nr:hypothetical protein [Pseudoalteromonas sp. NBT06-2]PAJ74527.1 hypothetical protein CJF42_09910 [Pseudoalteromonas sp. NBT06-2]
MNTYLKVLSLSIALTGSVYLPSVNAANSTEMLITIAESNPVLVEQLNDIALNDAALLNQLLKMADSKPDQLERLLNLAESDPETFERLIIIYNAEATLEEGGVLTQGIIDDDGGIIQT